MKKSKLLSVLTAGAIIATTVGTYAVWDTLSAETTAEKSVTFRQPVTVTVKDAITAQVDNKQLGETPEVTGVASFTVNNPGELANEIVLKPVIVSSQNVTIDQFDIEIYDKDDEGEPNRKLTETKGTGYIDDSVGSSNYTIKATPKDSTVYNKEVKLKLTAELK